VRIVSDIGVKEDQMAAIGHSELYTFKGLCKVGSMLTSFLSTVPETVNFHKSSFKATPFLTLDTAHDSLNQTVPDGILQIQPKLGMSLSWRV
jgi:hypothetical protein